MCFIGSGKIESRGYENQNVKQYLSKVGSRFRLIVEGNQIYPTHMRYHFRIYRKLKEHQPCQEQQVDRKYRVGYYLLRFVFICVHILTIAEVRFKYYYALFKFL